MTSSRLFSFVGADYGPWRVIDSQSPRGEPMAAVTHITRLAGESKPDNATWVLRGATSNERYVESEEKKLLIAKQEPLGRPASDRAAMILIRKNDTWWKLSQNERRHILETQSKHIATGLRYLPQIARALHHCRDLEHDQQFDFVTWFEYAESDAPAFNELVFELRASEEWKFIEREIDFRMMRSM
jgi:hypothetical protein